ncbi:MAG: glycosyltransferase [Candidatus Cryptobacteroides sp.]
MISIIICTYNREDCILRPLQALDREDFKDFEVVLVDNNSTDSTASLIRGFHSGHPDFPLRYFLETKQGLSFARNRGLKEARGETIVFLDDDAVPREGYLKNLSRHLEELPEVGAFGGRIVPLFEDCSAPNWLCRWSLSWLSAMDMGDKVKEFKRGFPIGANMVFRSQALKACGLFDTSLGRVEKNLMGGEEKDIFRRLKSLGHKVFYLPDVEVSHIIPKSRTSLDYVRRFADGVGRSERLRSKNEGSYPQRLLSEAFKWIASLVLFVYYLISLRPVCGATLVLFRAHVSRSLLRK